jgi:SHS2 domain-containing protein
MTEKNYKFLPHTADVRIEAYGKSLEEAFTNCAYAMTDVVVDHSKVAAVVEKEITAEGENRESLLYDFLEQFLILIDSDGFLLHEIKSLEISGNKLSVKCIGDSYSEKYEIHTHVKAVTYQEMSIEESKDGFVIKFIVDI